MNFRFDFRARFCFFLLLFIFTTFGAQFVFSQTPDNKPIPSPTSSPTPSLEKQFFKNLLNDQKAIWTSPFHLKKKDAEWLVPFGIATTTLIATDQETASWVSNDKTLHDASKDVSLIGKGYISYGVAGAFYLVGRATHNRRARETGLLSAEAMINSDIVVSVLKLATQRPRPLKDNGSGKFFRGGNSFPSGHAVTIWSLATVVGEEYRDKPLVRFGAYGVAAAVSISRFTGRNHFLSDILVGSAIGYGVGRFVYRKHHVDFTQTDDKNIKPPKKTTELFPDVIVPIYQPRNGLYGVALAWNF